MLAGCWPDVGRKRAPGRAAARVPMLPTLAHHDHVVVVRHATHTESPRFLRQVHAADRPVALSAPKQALTFLAGPGAGARGGRLTTAVIRGFVAQYAVNSVEAADPDIAHDATFNDVLRVRGLPMRGHVQMRTLSAQ